MSTDRPFFDLFGHPPMARADAPGRVNLIGEHTDYNGGFVLPLAIPQRTLAEIAARDDDLVRAWSANVEHRQIEEYRLGSETAGHGWLDYVQGVTRTLRLAGHELRGFELRIESAIPPGSGLSSSAALGVSILRALRQVFDLKLDDMQIALTCRKAENDFVGAPVGIMDPMASSLADETAALFLDTRSLQYEKVPLPTEAELVIIDSGISHRHAGGEYRTRRQECERAAELLGVPQLRDLDVQDLQRLAILPEPLDRRAHHVITENARVPSAVSALRQSDLPRLGKLLNASHASLRDDFQVSISEIDRLVELARNEPAVYGARLTGGGFGGSVVILIRRGGGREVGERIVLSYMEATGKKATVLLPAQGWVTAGGRGRGGPPR